MRLDDLRDDFGDTVLLRQERGRRLLLGELIVQLLQPRHVIRPFVGASIGQRRDRVVARCEPVACSEVPTGGPLVFTGDLVHRSVGVIGGVAWHPVRRLRVEGVVGFHDYPSEQAGTVEGGVLVGVQLWRSK